MFINIVIILTCGLAFTTGFHIDNRRKRSSESTNYFIKYVSDQPEIKQTATVEGQEIKLAISGGNTLVLDYKQKLLTVKHLPTKDECMVTAIDMGAVTDIETVSSVQALQTLLTRQSEFKMPTERVELDLQKSADQTPPTLSPLAAQLCEGLRVTVYEPKKSQTTAVAAISHKQRTKRDIGWGEILLIVVVIIILL